MTTQTLLSAHWQLAPFAHQDTVLQGVDDIEQCIANILSTHKGSDILRPEFGSDHFLYLDMPDEIAMPNMVREITQALARWETRIQVEQINISGNAPHFTLEVQWSLIDDIYREIYATTLTK